MAKKNILVIKRTDMIVVKIIIASYLYHKGDKNMVKL